VSYLADVKSKLEQLHIEMFEHAWKDVVEPNLKRSFGNGYDEGFEDARAGKPHRHNRSEAKPRRQWGSKHREREGAGDPNE